MNNQQNNVIKDKDVKSIIEEEAIRTRWKTYIKELLNEENPRESLEETHRVEGPEKEITCNETEKAIENHRHHQFLTPAIWRPWVQINDLHRPRSLVKSIAPLSVSPSDVMPYYSVNKCLSY